MSQHQENTSFVKNFSFTALLSFGILLGLLLLLSMCHGDYKTGQEKHNTTEQAPTTHH